ncbi:hypothetical protein FK949_gp317 [Paramecium bursaria Chlorella virus NYs1]|uniref:Uncharacterized protein n=1 Tax=Paramecium bursaria Chlorella virus NYs1 TaxID=83442 RepID=M1HHL9_9PHYC|nr:hypothetical protein FK949_gp317 [Paramecium bursaria Chlorella virus NYs1]AGE58808.1 hypothetical protein PBCVNYs1_614R [Paramecium bursaria Chlorella virus NYs1]
MVKVETDVLTGLGGCRGSGGFGTSEL